LEESYNEINHLIKEESLRDAVYLVLGNKIDLPNHMPISEINVRLSSIFWNTTTWYSQEVCATTGEGLYDGMEWLSKNIASNEAKKGVTNFVSESKDNLLGRRRKDKENTNDKTKENTNENKSPSIWEKIFGSKKTENKETEPQHQNTEIKKNTNTQNNKNTNETNTDDVQKVENNQNIQKNRK